MKRVVIVGSGLAGLSAGYRLHEQGCHVTVFESLGRVGGRVLSESENGFLFDVGPTIVTDNYTEYMKLVRDLGLSDKLVDCAPEVAVVKGSELHILNTRKPLRSFLTTKLLPPLAKLQLIARGVRLIKPLYGMNPYDLTNHVQYDTESIEAYIDRVFGRELNDLILDGVTRSMVTSSPDEASVVGFLAGAVTASGKMQTLKGGLQLVPTKLAEKLDMRLSSPVTKVRNTDSGVEIHYQSNSGGPGCERADACVIATPLRAAVEMYKPLKEIGADLLSSSKDSGCCSLQLMYSRRTEKEPFLVMVPKAASLEISTLFLEHIKAPDRAPAGTSLITAFFTNQRDIDFTTWSDDRLTGIARELIERLFPELHDHYLGTHLTRWSYAASQADVGYYKALQRFLDDYPANAPVQMAGDYMALPSQESAIAAGSRAATRILAA
ncbi:protoporphyrinogen oxidase [Mycobacterium sp. MFM001]|uniref:protoporphyrinogen/coproporphyrinogen oxidase n=1 Tax=Mycobacterium sp. MFM001 TaxID=2049453 RepID=UPI000DA446B2|nr:FAD-dependent oxidoreductase [Mycobacterium sp. MFM001]GBE66227.1 protoporphyrinogen oxidase [Mycobacterium sp. MFM001]